MHAPTLVIFDCDGVLVDSERIAVRMDRTLLAELGWTPTEEEVVELFLGRSQKDVEAIIESRVGTLPDDFDERFQAQYREALRKELQPVDGVVEALDAITTPTCVASSGSHDKMRFTLGLTGLYERFEGRIFSATEVEHGKPAPDLFLHAARAMDVAPANCVVVEDSQYGVQAARAAGMHTFAYAGGLTPAAWLEGPDTTLFHDMSTLPSLLEARS